MLLWLQTIPTNKKCCSQTFWMLDRWWLCLNPPCYVVKVSEDWRWFTQPPSPSNNFPLYQKVHFHSNEVRSRAAQTHHLPVDRYANSHSVPEATRGQRTDGDGVIRGSGWSEQQRNGSASSLESGLSESAQPNEILHTHVFGLWAC